MSLGTIFTGLTSNANASATPIVGAWLSGGVYNTGSDVNLNADAETSVNTSVLSTSLGIGAVGPSNASSTDSPAITAYVDTGTNVTSGGNITVFAGHEGQGVGAGASATADAAKAAIVGLGGATPTATENAIVNADVNPGGVLQATGNVLISAVGRSYGDSEANAIFFGGEGVGTSTPTTTIQGQTIARMDGVIAGAQNFTLQAAGENRGTSNGTSGAGGLLAGVGINSKTTITPLIQASVGNNSTGAGVTTSGNVIVTSIDTDDATGDGAGGAFGVVALGSVTTQATVQPKVLAFLGNNSSITSSGGSVTLQSLHDYDLTRTRLNGFGAHSIASGAGSDKSIDAGVVSISTLSPTALSDATVQGTVNPGATINAASNVSIYSLSDNSADTSAGILNFSVVGYGGVTASSTSKGTTQAELNNAGGILAGGDFNTIAQSTGTAQSDSTADGGGVLNIGASNANSDIVPSVLATVSSSQPIEVGGNATIQGVALGTANAYAAWRWRRRDPSRFIEQRIVVETDHSGHDCRGHRLAIDRQR